MVSENNRISQKALRCAQSEVRSLLSEGWRTRIDGAGMLSGMVYWRLDHPNGSTITILVSNRRLLMRKNNRIIKDYQIKE